jgi:hypothetical protein
MALAIIALLILILGAILFPGAIKILLSTLIVLPIGLGVMYMTYTYAPGIAIAFAVAVAGIVTLCCKGVIRWQ